MAFSPDFDIYNWLLVEILKVQPTGDPVNDAVYLVLLQMVVLYMFVDYVAGSSRFKKPTVKLIIMFIMGFFIVREGFYPLFAGFSLPLLIIIMLLHMLSFIAGKGKDEGRPAAEGGIRRQPGSGNYGILGRLFHPLANPIEKARSDLSRATWSKGEIMEEAGRLMVRWKNLERIISTAGSSAFGKSNDVNDALEKQEEIEEELANLTRLKKVDIIKMIGEKYGDNDPLKKNIELKLSI